MLDTYIRTIRSEVEQSQLQSFARCVDRQYEDAWYRHFTNFQDFDRFQVPALSDEIYDQISDLFPMHFHVLWSLMFRMRQSQMNRVDYSDCKRKLMNYFFSMMHVRDPASLVHWAMVGTIRNPLVSAFSAGKKAMDAYLTLLYQSTQEA